MIRMKILYLLYTLVAQCKVSHGAGTHRKTILMVHHACECKTQSKKLDSGRERLGYGKRQIKNRRFHKDNSYLINKYLQGEMPHLRYRTVQNTAR